MKSPEEKRGREKLLVCRMIALYCKKKHHSKDALCSECLSLNVYAGQRISLCPFMETKTFCSQCPVHCYQSDMREKIRLVMRFSGPYMIFYHPIAAIRHMVQNQK